MDLNGWDDNIDILLKILSKVFLYPFLFILGSGSRVAYDYYMNGKEPTRKQIAAHTILGAFTALLTYLIMRDLGFDKQRIQWWVLAMAFIGYTALQWLLENWHKYLPFNKNSKDEQE